MAEAKKPYRLDREELERVTAAMADRGVTNVCARCGKSEMQPLPVLMRLQFASMAEAVTGGFAEENMPTLLTTCNNCGWVALHALGVLGLMEMSRNRPGGLE